MSVPAVTFFGGLGKTTLAYHLAWSYADKGQRVLAVDLDPNANLTAAFLDEDDLEAYWRPGATRQTIASCVEPLQRGTGDFSLPRVGEIAPNLGLLAGDPALARFEDTLSEAWPKCQDGDERALLVTSAVWRIVQSAARAMDAGLVLVDLGPGFGAINRVGLISSDLFVTPVTPDLLSLQGLRNAGSSLADWRDAWQSRVARNPDPALALPRGVMRPAGYVVRQQSVRLDRAGGAYEKWMRKIPAMYATAILDLPDPGLANPAEDPNCLKMLKHYRSLIPLAQDARKPIFHLKPADGAIGAHLQAVQSARDDFEELANKILGRLNQLRS